MGKILSMSQNGSHIGEASIKKELKRFAPASDYVSGKDLIEMDIQEVPSLLYPILPKSGVVALAGSSDTGKSSYLRHLASAIVTQESEFIGFPLKSHHGRCIYVSTEDDDAAVSAFLRKTAAFLNKQAPDFEGLEYIFDTENLLGKLEKRLQEAPVDLIVIDAFSDLYSDSMNETNKIRNFINQYSQLAQKYKCLIMFLHHCGKRSEERMPSKNNLLGSQGFEAKMRTVLELRVDLEDPSARHLCIVKGNYLKREFKESSFVLKFNDQLCFEKTEQRVPFENLVASDRNDNRERARGYRDEGKSQSEIAELFGVTQGAVSKWLK